MTDDDALDTIKDVLSLRGTDAGMESLATTYGLERIRAAHALMAELMPVLGSLLHDADEKELAEARARVAEIEKRLEASGSLIYLEATADGEVIRHASKASLPVSDYDQTDAGMGIGGGREPAQSADDFRDELAELRELGVEKRRKRGI